MSFVRGRQKVEAVTTLARGKFPSRAAILRRLPRAIQSSVFQRSITMALPAPTARATLSANSPFLIHAEELLSEAAAERDHSERVGPLAKALLNRCDLYTHKRHLGDERGAAADLESAVELAEALVSLDTSVDAEARGGIMSSALQALAAAQTFEAFLKTGTYGARPAPTRRWAPVAAPKVIDGERERRHSSGGGGGETSTTTTTSTTGPGVTSFDGGVTATDGARKGYSDGEWLQGLIQATHEMVRYAAGAATVGDTVTVEASRDAVSALHEALLTFDLRNGPLRKSYDGVKYCVRRLEELLYDLSLAGHSVGVPGVPPAPLIGGGRRGPLLDVQALVEAREAYEAHDAARELCLKRCRDVQKLAKQAIFSLHRAEAPRAAKQIDEAASLARELLDLVVLPRPALRSQGAVRSCLEELAEAILFRAWLEAPLESLLLRRDDSSFRGLLDSDEYIGGLCDLTGEIGRYAVGRATVRDAPAVRSALATCLLVQTAILRLGAARRVERSKGDALRNTVRKLEQLMYELSLAQAAGREFKRRESEPLAASQPPADDDSSLSQV